MYIVKCADHLVEPLSCDVDFTYCREIVNSLDGYNNAFRDWINDDPWLIRDTMIGLMKNNGFERVDPYKMIEIDFPYHTPIHFWRNVTLDVLQNIHNITDELS